MFWNSDGKKWVGRIIHNFFLCWALVCLNMPSQLFSQTIISNDQECELRAKTAYILTGATIIALAGVGVAYAASSSWSHRHCCSSYSSCYSSYSCGHSYCSSYSRSSHSHRHSYSDSSWYSSSSYSDRTIGDRFIEGQFPLRHRRGKGFRQSSEESNVLSGSFIVNSVGNQGTLIAFVQLPDGTRQTLGHLSLAERAGCSLSYGPFDQEGNYFFGVAVDQEEASSQQTRIGSVEIEVNGSKVQSYDFIIPAYSPAHYEPAPCSYHHS